MRVTTSLIAGIAFLTYFVFGNDVSPIFIIAGLLCFAIAEIGEVREAIEKVVKSDRQAS